MRPRSLQPVPHQSATTPLTKDPSGLRYVPALDGLRAIAVLAVIAYHLNWPLIGGGFLGVDLFFVLSGFLITAILLKTSRSPSAAPRSLRSDLIVFYLRRTRRLLPALTVLLLAVSAWAAFVALPEQITNLRAQGLGAVFYVSNWVFIAEDTTYFEAFTDPSPLQHTWTLAIEEQFYLVWPVVVLVFLARRHRSWLIGGSLAIAAASAVLMWTTASSGALNTAYLGTFTRVHELMIGALAALLIDRPRRGQHRLSAPRRTAGTITGTITVSAVFIGASMVLLSPQGLAYYQGGSVLFSVVAAVLILTLVRHRPDGGAILGNPVLRWIGAISYGLYLWHWPMIVWLTPATTSLEGLALDAVRLTATFAAAAVSYYAIEKPIRHGGWQHLKITTRAWWWAVPTSMAVTATLLIAATSSTSADTAEASPASRVAAADHLLGSTSTDGPSLLIIGDSVPQEVMPALGEAAAAADAQIIPLAFGGCSAVGLFQIDTDGSPFTWSRRCTDTTALQDAALAEHSPDTVIWYSNRERFGVRTDDGEPILAGTPEHRRVMEDAIWDSAQRLTASGANLLIVQPAPKAQATIGLCAREPESADCAASSTQVESFTWLRSVYSQVAAELPGVNLISVDDVLCPSGAPCGVEEIDGIPIRPDGVHIANDLEPWFAEILMQRILDAENRQWR